ncbi:unnamed protein product [Vitrella brassicaformis CCMP3155]|uniref:Serine aminopeptidase S33 domain-containing protein n=2 Tax=Vitrella brassicaformis TaxID=1169539 RepID=A0A0G4EWU9_VITBC|nr:unnamed protein product [Vitrella brassicaformis CCMP3155]|mmetsp:Transcript_1280/g.3322  ORF Transcript_1280/g.3322 Transcript_1280/m.3322 type:complete len:435 (+) Transcript_1280:1-1305(+)|eukprot:CEM02744.1 unnamed protein product [Vitrella brassicaformis CCMP3155]
MNEPRRQRSARQLFQRRQNPFQPGSRVIGKHGTINYTLEGEEGAPLCVCIHGLNSSMGQYEDLAVHLIANGYRVLRFDLYGHGMSSTPKMTSYGPEVFVGQVGELLHKCGLGETRFSIIGFSMGGLIAALSALAYRDRIDGVVLLGPAGMLRGKPSAIRALDTCGCCIIPVARNCASRCCVKRDDFMELFYDSSEHAGRAHLAYTRYVWRFGRTVETLLRVARGMPLWDNPDPFEQLASLDIPVLLGWGVEDDVTPISECWQFMRSTFPTAPILLYPNAKHQVLIECFPQVSRDILAFLLRRPIPAVATNPPSSDGTYSMAHVSAPKDISLDSSVVETQLQTTSDSTTTTTVPVLWLPTDASAATTVIPPPSQQVMAAAASLPCPQMIHRGDPYLPPLLVQAIDTGRHSHAGQAQRKGSGADQLHGIEMKNAVV